MTKVAEILNYESLQSFSKAFRRVMGVTPTVYLRMEPGEGNESSGGVRED